MVKLYSVWVGGGEVNDYYLTWKQALQCRKVYIERGYKDTKIRLERVD